MAPNVDTTSGATLFFAFVAALFCFISFATLGWSILSMSMDDNTSSTDITIFVGLRRMCTEITATFIATGDTYSEQTCEDFDCEGLDDSNCTHLKNAQSGGAVATAAAALLIILAIVLALVDRMAWRTAALVTYVINIALAIIFALAAFMAIAEWQTFIDSHKEAGVDVEPGYSWALMLIAGILACFCIVGSIMGFKATSKNNGVAADDTRPAVELKA